MPNASTASRPKNRGFDAYVEAEQVTVYKKARACATCVLAPAIRGEIEALRRRSRPVPFPIISQYLETDYKIEIAVSALQKHFAAHVKAPR